MDNQKEQNTLPLGSEERLLEAIFKDDEKVAEAGRKAAEWLTRRGKAVAVQTIVDAVEVAQMGVAADFDGWDEMKDDEKNDLAEVMLGLIIARDVVADAFGLPMKGHIVEEGEEDGDGEE